jgi:DNA-binding transcriptional MerR regulator
MDLKIPDKLTFKRKEVIKITRLDGKVLDYWEKEFGGLNPVVNKLGEKFYTKKDVETIVKIKQMLIVEKRDKEEIKKTIGSSPGNSAGFAHYKADSINKTDNKNRDTLNLIRKGLQEILTLLNKNVK